MSSERHWHHESAETTLAALDSRGEGLSAAEAARRLAAAGPNELPRQAGQSALRRFLAQFDNVLIYFLLVAAVAAGVLEHLVDAAVIVTVVIVNAVVGYVQEGRAEQALDAIRRLIAPEASVLRDGSRQRVPVRELVRGDVVLIEAGDRVPADLRLLRARRLLIDEALLTGESMAASKTGAAVPADTPLGDRAGMAWSGTLVAAGTATGVVVATGLDTQIGHISRLLLQVEPLTTPLLQQVNQFARRFTGLVLAGGALLFAFAVFARGYDWVEALIAVVALAVGIVPEGLPAVITITLAVGVRRMAARNAVIRRLPAVETLGATSVICSDKTGTLTRNEMTARRIVTAQQLLHVEGVGYSPEGAITAPESGASAPGPRALELLLCAALCNDARVWHEDNAWHIDGDPMEAALLTLARKAGLDVDAERAARARLDEIPFDAAHRFMATLHRDPAGGAIACIKGAAEALFAMTNTPDREFWEARITTAGNEGERLLAFGIKRFATAPQQLDFPQLAEGVEFLGLVGFIDPPRPEAREAVAQCHSARIEVKMITGDHAATAAAIARQLGIADNPGVTSGAQIERMSENELRERVATDTVFARASPEHKLRIVRALQSRGHIVAMTGDGVNDAPSLRQADVGTAMGIKGTEAAREASEMVLLDDNFASIVSAVREGRTVHDNIRKVISWEIPTNGAETVAVVLAILAGFSLPMSATQILWVNLILAVTLGLVLAFEPTEPGAMRRPPRAANAPLLSPFLVWRIALVSVLLAAAALGVFFWTLAQGRDLATARTMVVNMFIIGELFYLFNVRYLHASSISLRGLAGTPAALIAIAVLIVAQALFTYAPFMQRIFDSRALGGADLALLVAIGALLMGLLEAEKWLLRRLGWFSELAAPARSGTGAAPGSR